jgi:hypothetical protein
MAAFVLVHSPVTGPSTWRWVADELVARGHQVTVPSVPPAATALGWSAFVGAVGALAAGLDRPVLVGHSGAGPLLPRIATRLRARALVFVDAGVPPEAGETSPAPADFLEFLQGLANDGVLPPWSEWFGPDGMREQIPDARKREIVSAELPTLPLSYFQARVPVPAGWTSTRCGYVLLSDAYAEEASKAAASGWPVVRLPGAHLDIVTHPAVIADAILSVAGDLTVAGGPGAGESGTSGGAKTVDGGPVAGGPGAGESGAAKAVEGRPVVAGPVAAEAAAAPSARGRVRRGRAGRGRAGRRAAG